MRDRIGIPIKVGDTVNVYRKGHRVVTTATVVDIGFDFVYVRGDHNLWEGHVGGMFPDNLGVIDSDTEVDIGL